MCTDARCTVSSSQDVNVRPHDCHLHMCSPEVDDTAGDVGSWAVGVGDVTEGSDGTDAGRDDGTMG